MQGKKFDDAVKQDMKEVVKKIDAEDTALDTKRTEKECVKCFYRWLVRGEDEEDEEGKKPYPKIVSWIKTSAKKNQASLPKDIWIEEEVKRLAEIANNPRDRAMILVDYETGGRVGETLPLSVGDISFDKYGAILRVSGKTGERRIRIIFSAKALAEWLNHHPEKNDQNAPLWTAFDKVGSIERLKYAAYRKMLKTSAKRAGISKRISPKSFRHARATNLANDLTEMQMREYFGWSKDSDMPSVYVHLSGRNVDNALFKINGIKTEEEVDREQRPLKPQQCVRCSEVNSPSNRFCARCGSPLDVKTALDLQAEQETTDAIMNGLFEDPRFRKFVEDQLRAKKMLLSG